MYGLEHFTSYCQYALHKICMPTRDQPGPKSTRTGIWVWSGSKWVGLVPVYITIGAVWSSRYVYINYFYTFIKIV